MNLEQNKFLKFLINPSFMKFQKNKEEKENEIMKRIKRIASLVLAMVMVFAMSVTAFASNVNTPAGEGNFTITIGDTTSGYSYQAFQIFSGDLNEAANGIKTLSNIEWGEGVDKAKLATAFKGTEFEGKTAEEVAKLLADTNLNAEDTDDAKAFAAAIANSLNESKAISATENTGVNYTISGLSAGYYFVRNNAVPTDGAYTRYILEVVGNVNPTPKRGVPTPDKKIVETHTHTEACYEQDGTTLKCEKTEDKVDVNEASIGDVINYEITGSMPSNIADYKTYTYIFADTLSKGLTFNNDVTVTVDGIDVTKYFYIGNEVVENGTAITIGMQDILALKLAQEKVRIDFTEDTKVVVTYSATLNTDAVIAGAGNPNEVVLQYSNNPNQSGEGATEPPTDKPEKPTPPEGVSPKKEVVTYTTELAILKTDEAGKILEGAEFTLTGNGVKVSLVTTETFESAEDGAYWKLKNGSYTTVAPVTEPADKANVDSYDIEAGKFNLVRKITTDATDPTKAVAMIDKDGRVTFTGLGVGKYTITESKTPAGYNTIDPITFEVQFDPATKTFSAKDDVVSLGVNNTLETTIVNQKGSLLPSTGGIGTTIFYVVGGILVIGAGILLVTKRRMKAQ